MNWSTNNEVIFFVVSCVACVFLSLFSYGWLEKVRQSDFLFCVKIAVPKCLIELLFL